MPEETSSTIPSHNVQGLKNERVELKRIKVLNSQDASFSFGANMIFSRILNNFKTWKEHTGMICSFHVSLFIFKFGLYLCGSWFEFGLEIEWENELGIESKLV